LELLFVREEGFAFVELFYDEGSFFACLNALVVCNFIFVSLKLGLKLTLVKILRYSFDYNGKICGTSGLSVQVSLLDLLKVL
jgi:hypothetical protein